jgi:predicted phage terminase large subunit-like protein
MINTELPPGALDAVLRNDMASFVKAAFAEVTTGVELVWAPYLDLICARLDDVVWGRTRNLIVTMPPRHLKSICVSVALPAFFLGHNPAAQVLAISYGQELARSFAEDTRKVMESGFYKRIFDTRLAGARPPLHAMRTNGGGIRRATSIDGAATGIGADLMIFDDAQKAGESLSEAIRTATNQAYENTFLSRRNNPATCRTVVVMQRLHEDDFVSHVLGLGGDWEVLNLPAIAEHQEAYGYRTFMGNFTFRRGEGEALHPARVPLETLGQIRAAMGEAVWATQYQQRPAPAGGGLVKLAWFKRYKPEDLPTRYDRVVQSWDTASTVAEWSDYSVCTTWGVSGQNRYLLDVWRKRVIYPDLKRAVVDLSVRYSASSILIEDHGSGTPLIQEFKREGVSKIEGHKPVGDKQMRMAAQTNQIEGGYVYIPEQAAWLDEYLHELSLFPNARYDDQVDSTSQALDGIGNPQLKGYAFLQLARQINGQAQAQIRPSPDEICYAKGSVEWGEQQARKAAREEEARLAAERQARQAQEAMQAEESLKLAA